MTDEWVGFFTTIAGVLVAAFTVLMVALQVRSTAWAGNPLRVTAALTSQLELLAPLLAALITIIPGHPWRLGSAAAGILGLAGCLAHGVVYLRQRAAADPAMRPDGFDRLQLRLGATVSVFVYGALVVAATRPEHLGALLLAGVSIWLLLSGSLEAWFLLTTGDLGAARDISTGSDAGSPDGSSSEERSGGSSPDSKVGVREELVDRH